MIAVGVNDEHLLLASFASDGPFDRSAAGVQATRALKTLSRVGYAEGELAMPTLDPRRTTTIEIHDLDDAHYSNAIRGLLDMFTPQEVSNMSVDATHLPLEMAIECELEPAAIAQRIQLGATPRVDAAKRRIVVELTPPVIDTTKDVAGRASSSGTGNGRSKAQRRLVPG